LSLPEPQFADLLEKVGLPTIPLLLLFLDRGEQFEHSPVDLKFRIQRALFARLRVGDLDFFLQVSRVVDSLDYKVP